MVPQELVTPTQGVTTMITGPVVAVAVQQDQAKTQNQMVHLSLHSPLIQVQRQLAEKAETVRVFLGLLHQLQVH